MALIGGEDAALPAETVLCLGPRSGGANADLGGGVGLEGGDTGSVSDSARTRGGGPGGPAADATFRAGGGTALPTGEEVPALEGRGGGGGGGRPGVVGGGTGLLGVFACRLLLGGTGGTAREIADETGRGGDAGLGTEGEWRTRGAGVKEEVGLALRSGGGALRGGAGAAAGGAGAIREGKFGAGRLGGAGAGEVGLGDETGLVGGAGAGGAGEGTSRLGIEGGFPKVGGFARLLCPAGFNFGIPPANSPPNWGGPAPPDDAEGLLMETPPPPPPPPPPKEDLGVSMIGALRSLTSAFLSFLPA